MNWMLVNVVWYDGEYAYVSKFVMEAEREEDGFGSLVVTDRAKELVENYLSGNGEVLKFDELFSVNLDNIIAYKNVYDDKDNPTEYEKECYAAYDRFRKMYGGC